MQDTDTPISQRVAAMRDADKQLVREIQMLERTAANRVVHGAANGRSPKDWSFERWIQLATLCSVVIGGIWFAGGKWTQMERDVATLKADMADVRSDLKGLNVSVLRLKPQIVTVPNEDDRADARRLMRKPGPVPQFPPEDRFSGVQE